VPPSSDVAEAASRRLQLDREDRIDINLDLLLANYQAVTANPRSMGYLRFLLKHYAKSPTPWRDCYKDNFKRFGAKTAGLCATVKDTIRQDTHWRHGAPKGPHAGHPDTGSPGVAIAEADAPAANPPWHGGGYKLSQDDGCDLDRAFMDEFGVDEVPGEVFDLLYEIHSGLGVVGVRRILLGLDPIPAMDS
jgi:hypothetical protein